MAISKQPRPARFRLVDDEVDTRLQLAADLTALDRFDDRDRQLAAVEAAAAAQPIQARRASFMRADMALRQFLRVQAIAHDLPAMEC